MRFVQVFSTVILSLALVADAHIESRANWPDGPFTTEGRWIRNAAGAKVTYVGVNWPGAGETMIPEGLQYESISSIVSKIKSLKMNVIRLTFATQMIDNILDGGDVTLEKAFVGALGQANGSAVLAKVLGKNPQFSATTTRLQVFDAIAAECLNQQIYVHLDNHVSKAEWCCSFTDGNSWFGDTYFDVEKWKRALGYMADHGKSWANLMSIGMRNELRPPFSNSTLAAASYGWKDWYLNMVPAASHIFASNPSLLIFFSGLDSDTTLEPITIGASLGNDQTFNASSFPFSNKIVLELHCYELIPLNCSSIKDNLYKWGFNALDANNVTVKNHVPVVMTEFGFAQDNSTYKDGYASCLREYLPAQNAGWMTWVIAGSYYIREGTQDHDEPWGLLSHNWASWRSEPSIENGLKPMIAASKAQSSGEREVQSGQLSTLYVMTLLVIHLIGFAS